MCSGFHACRRCEDTSPCSDIDGPNPNCYIPDVSLCRCCQDELDQEFWNSVC